MATYFDSRALFNDSALLDTVDAAVMVAANGLADSADYNAWHDIAFSDTNNEAKKALKGVIAANAGATVAQIQQASDASLQTNVDTVVDTLIKAKAGI